MNHLSLLLAGLALLAAPAQAEQKSFRVGHALVDITPTNYPVRVNAMFTERSASSAVDPLHVRAFVLDDASTRVAIAVVDTCMMARDLIDNAKKEASAATGIPVERMLVSATHTHSAPSAMACLGSRQDTNYAAFLPGKVAQAIVLAAAKLTPAEVGWGKVDAWEHTFNRRWIRRPDRLLHDPFGEQNVRAHMHPGHESKDVTGPSGPVDPALTILGFRTPDGRPLGIIANFSQHYYESPLLSADYFGRFAGHLGTLLAGGTDGFLAAMTQGTSGDLMWMDYSAPRRNIGYDAYAKELAEMVRKVYSGLAFKGWVPLGMAEEKLRLAYRIPSGERLSWAKKTAEGLQGRLPQSLPEIYALEAIHLHERPNTELVLQALRVGELGITAIPNEVYALTGLKLKAQSPFELTMNIELANGAEGYIPPPEQHSLGGYTTWPARTAGLEVEAEPRIVETLTGLLEKLAGKPRRAVAARRSPYTEKVLHSKPLAYWRLDDMTAAKAEDLSGRQHHAEFQKGIALWLPGVGSGEGFSPEPALVPSVFAEQSGINRSAHFAGGRLKAQFPQIERTYSVEFWLWNGLESTARAVTGYLFSRGPAGDAAATGDHLGIEGTYSAEVTGRLIVFNGNKLNQVLSGRSLLRTREWRHVAMVREGEKVTVYLDGEVEITGTLQTSLVEPTSDFFLGGRNDNFANFEGKLDEAAIYDRALSPEEVRSRFAASGLAKRVPPRPATTSAPLSPAESLSRIHVPAGFKVELAAAEPLTIDPVAMDWDAAGRMWVVEMADYPLGMDGAGKPGGRVRILEDTNSDGVYDRSHLFAEGLCFPTGLLTWRDGVIVTAAPEILFLRDTNADNRADQTEVLFSGFLEGNQQLRINGLRWGLDNWVYCAVGGHYRGYGAETKIKSHRSDKVIPLGSRDFRFRPDTGEFEPQSGPAQFGRNRDDWGNWFGTQNSAPLWHYVLQDEYIARNPHVPAPDPTHLVIVPRNPKVYPASAPEKRFHSFEQAGHFTSACSGMIYRDSALFQGGMHGFACEPFHNLVQHAVLFEEGVSFRAERDSSESKTDFFASEDRWCRPVMVRTGPDGALWVADMYRYMIEHPDWLPENGKAELLPHYREGDDKGRIYRVVRKGEPGRKLQPLASLSGAELAAELGSPNGWRRDKAQQMLLWKTDPAAKEAVLQIAGESSNPLAKVHALWTLRGLQTLDRDLAHRSVSHAHPGVRVNALRLAEGWPEFPLAAAALVHDENAKVRLQLACSLGQWTTEEAGKTLGKLAVRDYGDPFISAAVLSSALPHLKALAGALLMESGPALAAFREPLLVMALALNERRLLSDLLAPAFQASDRGAESFELFHDFLRVLSRRQISLQKLTATEDDLTRLLQQHNGLLDAAEGMAFKEGAPAPDRLKAARLLLAAGRRDDEAIELMCGWIDARTPQELQSAVLTALAEKGGEKVPGLLLKKWTSQTPRTRGAILECLLRREPWAFELVGRLNRQEISVSEIDPALRGRLLQHSSARVKQGASGVFNAGSSRNAVLEEYQPALKLKGNSRAGEGVFARACAACHQFKGQGFEIGPNLQSVASHPPEKLLANILDPNADVQPGFHAYTAVLTNGEEIYGVVASETANSIQLKLSDGSSKTIGRQEIAGLRASAFSFMPEGLESGISQQEMADLIAFLKAP